MLPRNRRCFTSRTQLQGVGSRSSLHPDFAPGRLWSLWDIMRTFHASDFVNLADSLSTLKERGSNDTTKLDEDRRRKAVAAFRTWETIATDMGLNASRASIQKIIESIEKDGATYGDMREPCGELVGRPVDELRVKTSFTLSLRESDHYEKLSQHGEIAVKRFPTSLVMWRKLQSALRCLGILQRSSIACKLFEACLIESRHFPGTLPIRGQVGPAIATALNKVMKKDHRDRTRFEKRILFFLNKYRERSRV